MIVCEQAYKESQKSRRPPDKKPDTAMAVRGEGSSCEGNVAGEETVTSSPPLMKRKRKREGGGGDEGTQDEGRKISKVSESEDTGDGEKRVGKKEDIADEGDIAPATNVMTK